MCRGGLHVNNKCVRSSLALRSIYANGLGMPSLPLLITPRLAHIRLVDGDYAQVLNELLHSHRATWLTGVTPRPPVASFASVPVSFPLIGLMQFTQYLVAARVSGLSPAELSACFSGVSGHFQGLVTAVAISSSKGDASPGAPRRHSSGSFSLACKASNSSPSLRSSRLSFRIRLRVERANPRRCSLSMVYSSKIFSPTFPRRTNIFPITLKLVYLSIMVPAPSLSRAHLVPLKQPFMDLTLTYARSACQTVPTKAKLSFPSESQRLVRVSLYSSAVLPRRYRQGHLRRPHHDGHAHQCVRGDRTVP
jgi:hypothetical protein